MEIYISLVLSILLFDHCTLAHGRIKDLLADTQAFRSYLKQLVRIDELKCLLQAEHLRRRQLQRIVRVFVRCFVLQTFSSMSSGFALCPMIIPE